MSNKNNKIRIDQLEELVEAKKQIQNLEISIEALDYHLLQISEDENFEIKSELNVLVKTLDEEQETRNTFYSTIKIHASEFSHEKIVAKKIKRLRKKLEELKTLFAPEP